MSSINEKLGIRPAGVRAMMKLPPTRDARSRLTAAQCPSCKNRGARESRRRPGWYWCSWCAATWDPGSG
jgi:hypothetical protein